MPLPHASTVPVANNQTCAAALSGGAHGSGANGRLSPAAQVLRASVAVHPLSSRCLPVGSPFPHLPGAIWRVGVAVSYEPQE
jgi:hypothetical protein